MTRPPARPWAHMGGEALRNAAKLADKKLGRELERLRANDTTFRAVLDLTLELDTEIEARRNPS